MNEWHLSRVGMEAEAGDEQARVEVATRDREGGEMQKGRRSHERRKEEEERGWENDGTSMIS
jgi:hypothetical protein